MSVLLLYLSEIRLIQPQDRISVLPLPITKSKNRFLFNSESTFQVVCLRYRFLWPPHSAVGYSHHNFLVDCLMSFKVYSLFGQSHTELITLCTFQIFKLSKNFTLIYICIYSQNVFYFKLFSFYFLFD